MIPQTSVLKLNLRWFSLPVREAMLERIDEISRGVAIGAGAAVMPVRTMKGSAGPLVNDPELVEKINPSLKAMFGKDKVIDQFPAVMGSEDFQEAFTPLGSVPYVFMLIGVAPADMFAKAIADGKPFPYSNHNPDFFVDLAAIPIGAKADTLAALATPCLGLKPASPSCGPRPAIRCLVLRS